MISLLTCLAGMVLALVVLDGVTAYVTGETNRGDRIISSFITILILYAIIMGIMSSGAENRFISDGIPFASIMDENTTLTSIMHEHLLTFCKETAELISLFFLISFIERVLPTNNSNLSLMITSRLILVLAGIVVNAFITSLVYESKIYQWALTTLQCLLSGVAIVVTPTMLIGQMLGIDPENRVLAYAIEQLPHTAVGQAFSSAVSRTAVLILGLMIYESQCGPLSGMIDLGIQLVYAIAPIVIVCIGISILLKSVFR